MALKKKSNTEKGNNENLELFDAQVLRAKEYDSGICVDLILNGVKIYGCWYRTYEDRQHPGDEKAFIAFPSRKGNDGKYYSYAYIKISDEWLEKIEKQIEEKL